MRWLCNILVSGETSGPVLTSSALLSGRVNPNSVTAPSLFDALESLNNAPRLFSVLLKPCIILKHAKAHDDDAVGEAHGCNGDDDNDNDNDDDMVVVFVVVVNDMDDGAHYCRASDCLVFLNIFCI